MSLPLYNDHQAPDSYKKLPSSANAGLWFDRFFNRYQPDWTLKDNDKSQWLKQLQGTTGDATQLEARCLRQIRRVEQLGGQNKAYKNDWYWVSGMGNPHPVENGLNWHPTLGVPYLAGSAVKGLVRAWVERNDDGLEQAEKENRLKTWFGTADKGDIAEQTGGFIFFDAIPPQPVTLITDIMTPHMGKWYAEGENASTNQPENLPADWHEPVPITFLAAKQTPLLFSIAPRGNDLVNQLPDVFSALKNALNWLGAGAKTATGYGYFSEDKTSFETLEKQLIEQQQRQQQEQQMQQQLQGQSPLAQDFIRQMHEKNWHQDKDQFLRPGDIESWLEQLQQNPDETIITHLVELVEQHIDGLLTNPDKTRGRNKKLVYTERQRTIAEQLNTLRKRL